MNQGQRGRAQDKEGPAVSGVATHRHRCPLKRPATPLGGPPRRLYAITRRRRTAYAAGAADQPAHAEAHLATDAGP